MARNGFAGKCRSVKLTCAFDDGAVDGHAFAGLHHDDVADGHFCGVYLRKLAVALDVGVIGGDIHHGCDGFARFAHGIALEQLADLVKQHYRATFGHRRLSVGERDHGECADRGDGHEQVLVEHLAVFDVAGSAEQHIVSGDQIGNQVQGEQEIDRSRFASEQVGERQQVLADEDDGEYR